MCAMNPRLLRPLASSAFSPKKLAGLAGWWDATATQSLFQSSTGTTAVTAADDPVGYWGDLSGNGRHLAQPSSGKRPLYKPGTLNGKPVLDFDGSDDFLSAVFALSQPVTIVCVARAENPASTDTLFDGGSPGNTMRLFTTNGTNLALYGGAQITSPALDPSEWGALSAVFNGASSSLSRDGATLASGNAGTASPGGLYLGLFGNGSSAPSEAQFAEFVLFNRVLSASEIAKVEGYLAWKWGLQSQLPSNHPYAYSFPGFGSQPRPSNADALDWESAVYANSGSVSVGTLAAVNTFANAIDAAGIRDRFYRLNLFCGTGLNAALVPLYRGPSRTGTQYGNTTDTNVGPFVSGDYAETGASGGLTSNGTSKYLNTGFKADTLGQTDRHLSMVGVTTGATTSKYFLGMDNFGCGSNAFWGILTASPTPTQYMIRAQAAASNSTAFSAAGGYVVVSGNGSAAAYADGVSAVTGLAGAYTAPNLDIYTHALNRCGTSVDYTAARLKCYSIGAAMTAGQVTSFYNALLAFNTSLSRA